MNRSVARRLVAAYPSPSPTAFPHPDPAELFARMMLMAEAAGREKPQFFTLREAAAYMGLSVTFLRKLIAAKILYAVRDGRLKVKRTDLDNLPDVAKLAEISQRGAPAPEAKEARR